MNNLIATNNELITTESNERYIECTKFLNYTRPLLREFYDSLDLSKRTISNYEDGIEYFLNWLSKEEDKKVNKKKLIEFKQYMTINLKPRTTNLYLSSLRQFFNFLEELGVPNFMRNIKNVKVGDEDFKIEEAMLQAREEKKLQYENKEISKKDYVLICRDLAIYLFAVNNALREIEMSRADKTDFRERQGKITFKVQGKGEHSKNKTMIVSEDTFKPIQYYLKVRENDKYEALFISLSNNSYGKRLSTKSIRAILKNIFKVYGGISSDFITGHSTRHTGATFTYDAIEKH